MSRGMPVPGEHPDHDLLADLAADVLPSDLAGRVQEHVMGCAYCAAVLAEAEGIRSLLLQSEPEPMPEAVWDRLERALVTARREDQAAGTGALGATTAMPIVADPATSAGSDGVTGSIGITGYMGATGTMSAVGGERGGRRAARSGPPPATTSIGLAGASSGPPTSRLNRMSRPTQRARRQAIEEQKADRTPLLSLARFGTMPRVAAGLLVFFVAVGLVAHYRGGSSDDDTAVSASAGKALNTAPLLAPVQSTDTNYSRGQLPSQVQTLITASQKLSFSGSAAAATPSATGQPSAGVVAPKAAASSTSASQQAADGQQLRSPAALQACLSAIGADQQPVAVDLARYAGQEAAIIVLPADGGGYQVEVVARDCRPGADGTIDVVTLKNP